MEVKTPLQEMYYIAEMVVGLAVIISIVFVAIELRQNTYMLRQSLADQREIRLNWLTETLCTDSDFRQFHRRLGREYDQMNDDDRYRAYWLGVRTLRSLFNELVAYYDGKISNTEFRNLEYDLKLVKRRPQFERAYESMKAGYPKSVQLFWENLDTEGLPEIISEIMPKTSNN